MIHNKISQLFALFCFATSVLSANHYVSDDLFTYTHNGPGTQYKILGIVDAGEKLEVLSVNKKAGYTEIKDKKGRHVWINSEHVSNKPGLKKQLENLNTKYQKLAEKLRVSQEEATKNTNALEKSLHSNIKQVNELKKINISLNKELKEITLVNESIKDKLDNEKNELLMKWFSYGGMVAGIGLFIGLILPSLIPTRKKKSRW